MGAIGHRQSMWGAKKVRETAATQGAEYGTRGRGGGVGVVDGGGSRGK